MNYLAKSDGTTLLDHSKLTEDRCVAIATELIGDEVSIAGVSREQTDGHHRRSNRQRPLVSVAQGRII